MKKIIVALFLGVMGVSVLTGCQIQNPPEEAANVNQQSFTSEKLGLAFSYPLNARVEESSELPSFDRGKKQNVSVSDENHNKLFEITATSEDFEAGIQEGCCYYYPGAPVDLSQSDEELKKELESKLGSIFSLERTKFDGREALRIQRTNRYISVQLVESILVPSPAEGWANLLITGPVEKSVSDLEGETLEERLKVIEKYLESNAKKGGEISPEKQRFNEILKTVRFL